jgi:hypothetical protein
MVFVRIMQEFELASSAVWPGAREAFQIATQQSYFQLFTS